jgi:hypothetical protein
VIILQTNTDDDPVCPFKKYLHLRDTRWRFNPELWLQADGTIPTSWFISCLHCHFSSDISGHSLRAGGATALAKAGVPLATIQALGRWASDAFQIYIRHHPSLLLASRVSLHT